MYITLRLYGERDGQSCDVTGYTVEDVHANKIEYLRSFLDFGAASVPPLARSGDDGQVSATKTTTTESPTVYEIRTGSCRASTAAAVLHFLFKGPMEGPLEVDGSNAAELLSLADQWCLDRVKAHVVACLRKNMCNSFKRPTAGSVAVEAVPQVAVLLRQALDFGVGDADGGLQRMYDECTTWMATWAARAWPTRTFANMPRPIQDDVLAAARAHVGVESAPSVLSACRQLSGMPSVAWARRIGEMRSDLTSYTLAYIWSNFPEICARAGLRQDRSECWGALLEELRTHVAENPDPDAAVRVLPRWAGITRALLYGAPTAAVAAALARRAAAAAAGGGGAAAGAAWRPQWGSGGGSLGVEADGASWLGEDEASQMQDLYDLVRSYCVRHLPLVARCVSFRSLPSAEQQTILLIAQEGICCASGLAPVGAPEAGGLLQPLLPASQQQQRNGGGSATAIARGGGCGASAASWVISLDSPAISTTSRPRLAHSGGSGRRRPPPAAPPPPPTAAVSSPVPRSSSVKLHSGRGSAAAAVLPASESAPSTLTVMGQSLLGDATCGGGAAAGCDGTALGSQPTATTAAAAAMAAAAEMVTEKEAEYQSQGLPPGSAAAPRGVEEGATEAERAVSGDGLASSSAKASAATTEGNGDDGDGNREAVEIAQTSEEEDGLGADALPPAGNAVAGDCSGVGEAEGEAAAAAEAGVGTSAGEGVAATAEDADEVLGDSQAATGFVGVAVVGAPALPAAVSFAAAVAAGEHDDAEADASDGGGACAAQAGAASAATASEEARSDSGSCCGSVGCGYAGRTEVRRCLAATAAAAEGAAEEPASSSVASGSGGSDAGRMPGTGMLESAGSPAAAAEGVVAAAEEVGATPSAGAAGPVLSVEAVAKEEEEAGTLVETEPALPLALSVGVGGSDSEPVQADAGRQDDEGAADVSTVSAFPKVAVEASLAEATATEANTPAAPAKPLLVAAHPAAEVGGAVVAAAAADVEGGGVESPRDDAAGASTQPSTPVRREAVGPVGCRPKSDGGDSDLGAAAISEAVGCLAAGAPDAVAETRCGADIDAVGCADSLFASMDLSGPARAVHDGADVDNDVAVGPLAGGDGEFEPPVRCSSPGLAVRRSVDVAAAKSSAAVSAMPTGCILGRGQTIASAATGGRAAAAATTAGTKGTAAAAPKAAAAAASARPSSAGRVSACGPAAAIAPARRPVSCTTAPALRASTGLVRSGAVRASAVVSGRGLGFGASSSVRLPARGAASVSAASGATAGGRAAAAGRAPTGAAGKPAGPKGDGSAGGDGIGSSATRRAPEAILRNSASAASAAAIATSAPADSKPSSSSAPVARSVAGRSLISKIEESRVGAPRAGGGSSVAGTATTMARAMRPGAGPGGAASAQAARTTQAAVTAQPRSESRGSTTATRPAKPPSPQPPSLQQRRRSSGHGTAAGAGTSSAATARTASAPRQAAAAEAPSPQSPTAGRAGSAAASGGGIAARVAPGSQAASAARAGSAPRDVVKGGPAAAAGRISPGSAGRGSSSGAPPPAAAASDGRRRPSGGFAAPTAAATARRKETTAAPAAGAGAEVAAKPRTMGGWQR